MFLSLNAHPEILNQLLLFRSSNRRIWTNFIIYYLYLKGHDSQMHHCSWPIKPIRPRRPKRLSLFLNPEKIGFYLFWIDSFLVIVDSVSKILKLFKLEIKNTYSFFSVLYHFLISKDDIIYLNFKVSLSSWFKKKKNIII